MPLFDTNYAPANNPYYANFDQSPQGKDYGKYKKKIETDKTAVQATTGVVGGVLSAFFPFLAPLFSAGQSIGTSIGNKDAAKREEKRYQKDYSQYQNSIPPGGATNPVNRNSFSSLSDYWGSKDTNQLSTLLTSILKTKGEDNTLNKISPAAGSGFNYEPNMGTGFTAPATDNTQMAPTDTPITNEMAPATGDASGAQEISITPTGGQGYKKGGMVSYAGGGLLQPMGEDDIALVDTKNQKDTGVRVQEGEMLVVSKDTLASLHKALKKGDHKKVYNLMKTQVEQAPKVEDGKHGFAKGGLTDGEKITNEDGYEVVYKDGKWTYAGETPFYKKGEEVPKEQQSLLTSKYERAQELKNLREGKIENPNQPRIEAQAYSTGTAPKKEHLPDKIKAEAKIPDVNIPLDERGLEPDFNMPEDSGETANLRAPEIPIENVPLKTTDETQPSLTKYPEQAIEPNAQPHNADWQKYARFYAPEALGTGFDIYRGIAGMNAAGKKLPTFQKGAAWGDYLNRLHQLSESGLTGNELSVAQQDIDNTYAYDLENIRNLSGGQSGLALGNMGRAANNHYKALANLTALNDEARSRNLGQYGGALTEDINLNRMIFGDKYNERLWTKQAGSQLANDAFKNIRERGEYAGTYGPNSYYDQLMQSQLKEKAQNERYTKMLTDYYSKNGFTTPGVGSLNFGG